MEFTKVIRGQVSQLLSPTLRWAPVVSIVIQNPANPNLAAEFNFEVDTAYSGVLTLPPRYIQSLALPEDQDGSVHLADGSSQAVRYFTARIDWHQRSGLVPILELDSDPLLGMALLWGSRLTVDAQAGGAVVIDEIPAPA